MIKLEGLSSGMVMQRVQDNACSIIIYAECEELHSSLGEITKQGVNRWLLTGIPTGGPYTLTLDDGKDSAVFNDLYVGDVWLLGGQSNMEGAGLMTSADEAVEAENDKTVRALYSDGHWDIARTQLFQPWLNSEKAIAEWWSNITEASPWHWRIPEGKQRDSVGPGLFFALEMKRLSGVPQGLIPVALGGSCMNQWSPDRTDQNVQLPILYKPMMDKFRMAGGNVRGMFWYQGESETWGSCDSFDEKMQHFVDSLRRDCDNPKLPFVQVQINSHALPSGYNDTSAAGWTTIRERQRLLGEKIPYLDTVASIDCGRDDLIHLSSASHHRIGRRAAFAMHALCGGSTKPMPQPVYFTISQNPRKPFLHCLNVYYKNLRGSLTSIGVPIGYSVTIGDETPYLYPYKGISSISLEGDHAVIHTEYSLEQLENATVWYGAGLQCICTITDSADNAVPAFGPMKVRDFICEYGKGD